MSECLAQTETIEKHLLEKSQENEELKRLLNY